MEIQSKIGSVNKALRTLQQKPAGSLRSGGKFGASNDEGIYLSCFYQVARESLHPNQLAAIEHDAQALLAEHRRMNNNSP